MKKSFILHIDTLSVLDEMSDEQAGVLFKAIKNYQNGIIPELDFGLRMAFIPFENQFKRDAESYDKVCLKNKKNGSKGGRPKKPTITQETQVVISKPKKADSDSDNDSDNNKNIFKQPTIDEVKAYCLERNKGVDAERWFNFYVSKGWLVGKTKMKDWKASVRTWEKETSVSPINKKTNDDLFYENVMKQLGK